MFDSKIHQQFSIVILRSQTCISQIARDFRPIPDSSFWNAILLSELSYRNIIHVIGKYFYPTSNTNIANLADIGRIRKHNPFCSLSQTDWKTEKSLQWWLMLSDLSRIFAFASRIIQTHNEPNRVGEDHSTAHDRTVVQKKAWWKGTMWRVQRTTDVCNGQTRPMQVRWKKNQMP